MLVDSGIVARHHPIGANDAVIAVTLAQQFGDNVTAVTHRHVLAARVDAPRHGIKRHHCTGFVGAVVETETAIHKRAQARLEHTSGINGKFPETVV